MLIIISATHQAQLFNVLCKKKKKKVIESAWYHKLLTIMLSAGRVVEG